MREEQRLVSLKVWHEEPTPVRGGAGNPQISTMGGGIKGEIQVNVLRQAATKVMGREADLETSQTISIKNLPEDIQKELILIFAKIENLL